MGSTVPGIPDELCRSSGHALGPTHASSVGELFGGNSFAQRQADGAKDAAARGLEAARRALDGYAAPALDPGVEEGLRDFVARREAQLPDRQG
jgi:trimethylamine:corrinoid methyltransferase-like protein